MVALQLLRGVAVRSVDVYVHGAVAVRTPAVLRPATDYVGEGPGGIDGVVDEVGEFFVRDIGDAEAGFDQGAKVAFQVVICGRGGAWE